jgi:hypothetical protein
MSERKILLPSDQAVSLLQRLVLAEQTWLSLEQMEALYKQCLNVADACLNCGETSLGIRVLSEARKYGSIPMQYMNLMALHALENGPSDKDTIYLEHLAISYVVTGDTSGADSRHYELLKSFWKSKNLEEYPIISGNKNIVSWIKS